MSALSAKRGRKALLALLAVVMAVLAAPGVASACTASAFLSGTELYTASSDYSVTFFIYHSSTVGNNLVDKATDYLN